MGAIPVEHPHESLLGHEPAHHVFEDVREADPLDGGVYQYRSIVGHDAAVDGQLEVRCDCVTARADSVVKTGHGERIVLEGHVKFEYCKGEQTVDASADRVVYDLRYRGQAYALSVEAGAGDLLEAFEAAHERA